MKHIRQQIILKEFFEAKASKAEAYFIKRSRKFVLSSDQSSTSSAASDDDMPVEKLDAQIGEELAQTAIKRSEQHILQLEQVASGTLKLQSRTKRKKLAKKVKIQEKYRWNLA